MDKIDIIIVNHNSTDCTIKALESIYATIGEYSANIYVADNASKDNPERLKDKFCNINMLFNKKNIGFSAAINRVIKQTNAPYVVLLNPDTVVINGFFKMCIEYLKNNEKVGILGPLIYEKDKNIQGSARRFPTAFTSMFGRKSPLTKMFPNNPITKKEFVCYNCDGKKSIEVDWVSGACMVVKRKAFNQVCGFDERFFLYWEDTDLCVRMRKKGWKIIYFRDASITHITGKSSSINPIFSTYHFHRSCYYLFNKHAKWPAKMFSPIVFLGLSFRALFVMSLHLFNKTEQKNINNERNIK